MIPTNLKQKSKKRITRFTFIFVLIFLLAVPAAGFLYVRNFYINSINTLHNGSSDMTIVKIDMGTSVREIAKQLKEDNLIADERIFEIYVRLNKLDNVFLAGTYQTSGRRSTVQIVEDLQDPIESEVKIKLPEGKRFTEYAEIIDKVLGQISPNWDKEEFISICNNPKGKIEHELIDEIPNGKSIEGFLFPDTYYFYADASAHDVIYKLVGELANKIKWPDGKLSKDIKKSGYTLWEVINFSSMVEREGMTENDRKMISNILIRRYENGWALGICATLLYEQGNWKHTLTQKELETATPYNTRVIKGLPPTPICSPSLESINAFIYPTVNNYWYYINDNDMVIHYAKTLEEHNANIKNYLR